MVKRRFLFGCLVGLVALGETSTAWAGWQSADGTWYWQKEDGTRAVSSWQQDVDGNMYYFDQDGKMASGWRLLGDTWYYLNNASTVGGVNPLNKPFGAALTGWQWIDKKCYYFQPQQGEGYGKMAAAAVTPDGYMVNADGQWVSDSGIIQTAERKGITSAGVFLENTTVREADSADEGNSVTADFNHDYSYGDEEVKEVINNFKDAYITSGMSDFEKEMMIIRYMVDRIEYDYENFKKNTVPAADATAYGALINGTAVCAGYADTFMEMAKACGLNVKYVSGQANGVRGWDGHAWNKVQLDGEWYNVDVTWEDPIQYGDSSNGYNFDKLRNKYINVTDAQLKADHKWSSTTPKCTATKYGKDVIEYYMMTGEVVKPDQVEESLKSAQNAQTLEKARKKLKDAGYLNGDESNFFNSIDDSLPYLYSQVDAHSTLITVVYSDEEQYKNTTVRELLKAYGEESGNNLRITSSKDYPVYAGETTIKGTKIKISYTE